MISQNAPAHPAPGRLIFRRLTIDSLTAHIVGIGTDIERVERFVPGRCSARLLARIFTAGERAYCESQARPERHYAARFAAKEATVKALSSLLPHLTVSAVEVLRSPEGVPSLRLLHSANAPNTAALRLHVSLSHSGEYATAFVIAEKIVGENA